MLKILVLSVFAFATQSSFAGLPPVSFDLVGSSPNSSGATVIGNKITLEPANATSPGLLTSSDYLSINYQYGTDRYVDIVSGSDSNDGSFLSPWATISYAETQITTATITVPFTIYVHGSGLYSDAGLVNMKPNINIVADGTSALTVTSQMTINAVAAQDGAVELRNMTIYDLTYDGTIANTATLVLNNDYTNDLIYKVDGNGFGYLTVTGGQGLGNPDITGLANIWACPIYGPFTVEDNASAVTINGSDLTFASIELKGQANLKLAGNTHAASLNGTVVGLNTPNLASDSGSFPLAVTGSVGFTAAAEMATGGFQLKTSGAQPTCDLAHRGTIWNIEGAAGIADIKQMCQKTVLDTYTWISF